MSEDILAHYGSPYARAVSAEEAAAAQLRRRSGSREASVRAEEAGEEQQVQWVFRLLRRSEITPDLRHKEVRCTIKGFDCAKALPEYVSQEQHNQQAKSSGVSDVAAMA